MLKNKKVEWKKRRISKHVDWDQTSKGKKDWLEIMLNVKNADMYKTSINEKRWLEKAKKVVNGKIVDKGTKGRREKTSNLFTRELK
jgi:hypothetical protein